jgi:predicted nuclease of restriction endonuclease-like (RecB) superfamily
MKKLSVQKATYENLRQELLRILEEGRNKAVAAVSEILVETYWQVGQRLSKERQGLERGEVTPFLKRLGADLGVSATVIHDAWRFYRAYPDGLPPDRGFRRLSWGTHTTLLAVGDERERAFYLEQAVEDGWSRSTLRKAIRADLYHRVTGDEEGGAGGDGPSSGDGSSSRDGRRRLMSPARELHNYVGVVERVVDGDTLEVRIDLGFDVWRVETIRLRGIDTPELGSQPGRQAKKFVAERLEEAPFVGLKTYKTDKYARYIADVFYHTEKTSPSKALELGVFLNQELLDYGFASILDLPV